MVELASTSICFNLAVPRLGGELLEPRLEKGELFRGKATDSGLKFLDAHNRETLRRGNNFDKVRHAEQLNKQSSAVEVGKVKRGV